MRTQKEKDRSPAEAAADHLELGKFYFLNQRYEEAIAQLNKALRFDEHNPDIYYNMGVVYEAINRIAEAKEYYEKALDLKPDMKSAQEHLERLVGV